jgi:5-methylcytosine-specific restriction endonuclease McrA
MPDKRTYADRREYNKAAVTARRRKLRKMAIEYGGGSCKICGYNKSIRALTFHHKNPSEKDFGLSDRGLTRSWDKTKAEIQKCILLCSNCHAEVHDGLVELLKQKAHR